MCLIVLAEVSWVVAGDLRLVFASASVPEKILTPAWKSVYLKSDETWMDCSISFAEIGKVGRE